MKIRYIKYWAFAAVLGMGTVSCEDFLNRPTEDNYNESNFYQNDEQCVQGVNYLYNSPWYDFQRGFIKVGEILSGNVYEGNSPYLNFTVNGTDENGITAQIVDCGTGFAKDYEDKDVEGKIALVGVDQFNESWIGGYIYEAYEHGAKALVTYDLDGYGRFSDDDHQIQGVQTN